MAEISTDCNKCVTCGKEFASDEIICPDDGGILVASKKDPAIGTIVAEKYEIQEVLGGGGMGVVYKAKHLLMHRTVALKMLLPETVSNEYALARFQKEAQAASSLNHPNILTIFDFGLSDKRQPYLVMDYLKGQTLADILETEGYLHLQRALSVFIQIASALAHAHQNGVVHRDLKPANIMLVEYEGQGDFVKIVDFGIAKTLHGGGGEGVERSVELTQTGQVFGSPLYMSPEQCRGTHLDARADIYSIGCVMYRSTTGKSPFVGQDALELMFKHVNSTAPKFADCCPELKLPQNFEDVVMKCLEKDVDSRYQTMLELRHDLERVAGTSINSPFIFPAGEVDASKTPPIGSLEESRETLNTIIALTESQKQLAHEVAAAQARRTAKKASAESTLGIDKARQTNSDVPVLSGEGAVTQIGPEPKRPDANATLPLNISPELAAAVTASVTADGAAASTATASGTAISATIRTSSESATAPTSSSTSTPTVPSTSSLAHGSAASRRFDNSKILLMAALGVLILAPLAVMIFHKPSENKPTSKPSSALPPVITTQKQSKAGDELKAGDDFFNKGDYVQAKESLQRARDMASLDKNNPVKFESNMLLGQIDIAEGNYDSAKSNFYAIVDAYNQGGENKPSDVQAAVALNGLGVVETNQAIYNRAHVHFSQALALRQKMPAKDADVWETLLGMGTLALYEKNYKVALDYFTTAKKTSEQVNGADHIDTANILNDMGQAYQFLKKYSEADSCYKQALAIRQKKLSPTDPAIASTQMCMAALAFNRHDFVTSEKLFLQALDIDSKALGTDNLLVSQIYFSLGVLYQQQKKYDQAADYYQKALDIQKRKMDANNPKLAHTKALLDQVKNKKRR